MISILQGWRIFYQHEATVTVQCFASNILWHWVYGTESSSSYPFNVSSIGFIRFLSLHSLETFFWPHTGSVLRNSSHITTARLGPRFTGHITRSRSHFRHRSVSHGCRLEPLPVPSYTDKRTTHSSVLPAPLLSVCAIVLRIDSTISRLTL